MAIDTFYSGRTIELKKWESYLNVISDVAFLFRITLLKNQLFIVNTTSKTLAFIG
jgi:hypothetical protein